VLDEGNTAAYGQLGGIVAVTSFFSPANTSLLIPPVARACSRRAGYGTCRGPSQIRRSPPRCAISCTRFDYLYRDFLDFYLQRTDLTTGRVTSSAGQPFDRSFIENTDDLKRRYQADTWQVAYRAAARLKVGGNYMPGYTLTSAVSTSTISA
jgi:hypothetical protein